MLSVVIIYVSHVTSCDVISFSAWSSNCGTNHWYEKIL